MSNIPTHFPNDSIMIGAAKKFMFVCMLAFINALRLRKKEEYVEKNIGMYIMYIIFIVHMDNNYMHNYI